MVKHGSEIDRDLFEPLRPARGTKLVLAALIGPVAWVVAWLVAAWMIQRTDAIEFGLLITAGAFLLAFPVLALLHWGRKREERYYEREGCRPAERA